MFCKQNYIYRTKIAIVFLLACFARLKILTKCVQTCVHGHEGNQRGSKGILCIELIWVKGEAKLVISQKDALTTVRIKENVNLNHILDRFEANVSFLPVID